MFVEDGDFGVDHGAPFPEDAGLGGCAAAVDGAEVGDAELGGAVGDVAGFEGGVQGEEHGDVDHGGEDAAVDGATDAGEGSGGGVEGDAGEAWPGFGEFEAEEAVEFGGGESLGEVGRDVAHGGYQVAAAGRGASGGAEP